MIEPMRLRDLAGWVDPGDRTHRRLLAALGCALGATVLAAVAATGGGTALPGALGALAVCAWGGVLVASRRTRDDYRNRLHVALFLAGGVALLATTLYALTRGLHPSALFEDGAYTALALTAAALLAAVGAGLLGEVLAAFDTLRRAPTDPEEVLARVLDD